MDTDAELNIALRARCHRPLNRNRAAHRLDDARKLNEKPIAHCFESAAVMHRDRRIDKLRESRLDPRQRALLVGAHQQTVAGHVSGKDRGKAAACGDFSSNVIG